MTQKILTFSKRCAILSCEAVLVIATLAFLASAGLLFRLSQGPLLVNALRQPVQDIVNENIPELYQVRFQDVSLYWPNLKSPIEVRLENLDVSSSKDGAPVMAGSEIGFEISVEALFDLKVTPGTLNFYDLNLALKQDDAGVVSLDVDDFSTPLSSTAFSSFENEKTLKQDSALQSHATGFFQVYTRIQNSDLKYLKKIRFLNTGVTLDIPRLRTPLALEKADLIISNAVETVRLDVAGDLTLHAQDQTAVPVNVSLSLNPKQETHEGSIDFKDLDASSFVEALPETIKQDLTLSGVMSGQASFICDDVFNLQNARFDLEVENGTFQFKETFSKAIPIEQSTIKGTYDFLKQHLEVNDATLTHDDFRLGVTASHRIDPDLKKHLAFNLDVENSSVKDLSVYWPLAAAKKTRDWVLKHVEAGFTTKGYYKFAGTRAPNEKMKIDVSEGVIPITGGRLNYLESFPVLKEVTAEVRIEKDEIEVSVERGVSNGMIAEKAKASIYKNKNNQTTIDLNIPMRGEIQSVFQVLDHPKRQWMTKIELPQQDISGHMSGVLDLNFSLTPKINPKEIVYTVKASSDDASWRNVFQSLDLKKSKVDLVLTRQKFDLKGRGDISSGQTEFDFHSDLIQKTSVLNAKADVDAAMIDLKHLTFLDAVKGRATVDLNRKTYSKEKRQIDLSLDLSKAHFSFPSLKTVKDVNVPAVLNLTLHQKNDQISKVENIKFKSPVLSVTGDVDFAESKGEYSWTRAKLNDMKFKNQDLDIIVENEPSRYVANVKARVIDFESFFSDDDGSDTKENKQKKEKPIVASVKADNLKLALGETIKNAKSFLHLDSYKKAKRFELDGTAGAGALYIRYTPEDIGHHLRVEADDAGHALKALGITQSVRGGVLVIDAKSPSLEDAHIVEGNMKLGQFTLVGAPVLARILNGLSLATLPGMLAGEGMNFQSLTSAFQWHNGKNQLIDIIDGRTTGASLGLSFEGGLDLTGKEIDLKGRIVPVSGLNKAVSKIPVFGELLGGGDGVFAATYKIRGDMKDPKVTVNPLAVLAPGVFRKIFFE